MNNLRTAGDGRDVTIEHVTGHKGQPGLFQYGFKAFVFLQHRLASAKMSDYTVYNLKIVFY